MLARRLNLTYSTKCFSLVAPLFVASILFLPAAFAQLLPRAFTEVVTTPKQSGVQSSPQFLKRFDAGVAHFVFSPLSVEQVNKVRQLNATADRGKVLRIGVVQSEAELLQGSLPSVETEIVDGIRVAVVRLRVTSPLSMETRAALVFAMPTAGIEVRVQSANVVDGPIHFHRLPNEASALDSDNRYWTPATEGESQLIEVRLPIRGTMPSGLARVTGVTNVFASQVDQYRGAYPMSKGGESGTCNVDAMCAAQTAPFVTAKRAVAHMRFIADGSVNLCSGTLLVDEDPSTTIPYFYTADHCFRTASATAQSIGNTLETYWGYESPSCRGPVIDVSASSVSKLTGGADVLYTEFHSDVMFLRLRGTPPTPATYLGWDANPISGGAAITVIHHPSGDMKKVTIGRTAPDPFDQSVEVSGKTHNGSFIAASYSSGVVEGGSSGSGLLTFSNNNYFLRGGLLGGASSCSSNAVGVLDNPNNGDFYSRLDLAYPALKRWLSPGSMPAIPTTARTGIDIDGSGRNQIVVRSSNGQMQIARWANNSLSFTPTTDPGSSFRVVAAGDFNADGRTDLAFQNMSQGVFGDVKTWSSFASNRETLFRQVKQVWDVQAVGDLDGDGFADLVWRYVASDPRDTGVSFIWFTNGSSVTQVRKRGGAPLDWTLLGALDLNADGAADMVYISPANQVRALMATPNRTCANLSGGTLPTGYRPLKFADFTGNQRGDILLRNASGQIRLYTLNGSGLALPPYTGAADDPLASCTSSTLTLANSIVSLPTVDSSWEFYSAADLNGDGINDIVWRQNNGTLSVWIMGSGGRVVSTIANAGVAPSGFSVIHNGYPGATTSPVTPGAPAAPNLVFPADGASVTTNLNLIWTAVPGAAAYSGRIRNLSTGQVSSFFTTSSSTTLVAPASEISGVTFSWTVASCTASTGDTSANCPNVSISRTFVGQTSTIGASPEGFYEGFATNGAAFKMIVLENNELWTVYGAGTSAGGLEVSGLVQGQGTATNGTFTSSSIRAYDNAGGVTSGSLTGTYVAGSRFNGSFSGIGFTGTVPTDSQYAYGTPASLAQIAGNWSGMLVDGMSATATIGSNGSFSGRNAAGCTFSGSIVPRYTNKNVFNTVLVFGGAPCQAPNQSASGIGVTYLLPNNQRQLVVAVTSTDRALGTVFMGTR